MILKSRAENFPLSARPLKLVLYFNFTVIIYGIHYSKSYDQEPLAEPESSVFVTVSTRTGSSYASVIPFISP